MLRLFATVLFFAAMSASAFAEFVAAKSDQTLSGSSAYPTAVDLSKVGKYPGWVKSGAGYFYDDVLEYRVWLHPERGAPDVADGRDYFVAFAEYERALDFSRRSVGAEAPLVLIRQMKHINEPTPGVFEVVEGERLAEWKVEWLPGSKRVPGAIEQFMAEHRK